MAGLQVVLTVVGKMTHRRTREGLALLKFQHVKFIVLYSVTMNDMVWPPVLCSMED